MTWSVATEPTKEPVSLDEARAHLKDPEEAENPLIESLIAAARQHVERVCERALMPQTWRISLDAFPDAGGAIEIPGGLVRVIDSVKYFDAVSYSGTYVRTGSSVVVTLAGHAHVVGDSAAVTAASDSALAGGQTVTAADTNTLTFVDADAAGATTGSITVQGRRQTLTGFQADLERQPARLLPPATGTWPSAQSARANAVQVLAQVGYAGAEKVPVAIKAALLLILADLFENREASVVGVSREDNPAVKALLWPYRRVVP